MADGETTTIKEVPNFRRTIQQANGYEIVTANWQGEYDSLREKSQGYPIGLVVDSASEDFPEATMGSAVIIANNLTRREGKLADLSISLACVTDEPKCWFCSLDMVAVPKDIRTWKPSGQGEEAPDLTKIQYWEGTKESEPTLYAQYKYREPPPSGSPEGTLGEIKSLGGNTKKLAEMMFAGVTSYTIHAPCLTATTYDTTLASFYAERIDNQCDASALVTRIEQHAIGSVNWDSLIETVSVWILTDLKVTTQANGLNQMTIRWIGADEAREELYPKASM